MPSLKADYFAVKIYVTVFRKIGLKAACLNVDKNIP